ncbi:MAG: hypothetical protein J0L51_14115 [Rhizobiales bacterium]|nr:hypothetical protein [Hyphomicrobiales bacterium]
MRLLLINGNTTQAVTDHCVSDARLHVSDDTILTGVTARYGADIVTAEPENLIASMAVLERLAEHYKDHDAAILAISFDSGLLAARDLVPIPIIGMTEAALLDAAAISDRLGMLVFGTASLPLYRAMLDRYPMRDRVVAIQVVEVTSVSAYLDATRLDEAILAALEEMRRRASVDAVVICGAVMSGVAERLQPLTSTRLFGGMKSSVRRAQALLQSGAVAHVPRSGLARSARVMGLSPSLMALFENRGAQRSD